MPIREATDPATRSMTGLHLYHFFLSNCAQRAALALAEKGLDFTPHSVNLIARANTRDEYFRVNPAGLVPALVHDGVVITESIDILRYLEERFPDPPLYPSDPTLRQRVDAWMDDATNNHNRVIKTYMYALVFGGEKTSEEMQRYVEKQKTDLDLVEFHKQATGGFSEDRILEAERAKDAVGRAITHAFAQHGLVIAFPQRTLWWGDGAKPGESDG